MTPEAVKQMLADIFEYYPIGMPAIINDYEGTKKIKEHIKTKIDKIEKKIASPWSQLVLSIKNEYSECPVFDYSFSQFPSYLMSVELQKNVSNDVTYIKSVILSVSLLSDFYTIYFQDLIEINSENKQSFKGRPLYYNIAYFNSCLIEDCYNKALRLKKTTETYFPKAKFVEHRILFDYKLLGGVKYGEFGTGKDENCIYEFLFDNLSLPDVVID